MTIDEEKLRQFLKDNLFINLDTEFEYGENTLEVSLFIKEKDDEYSLINKHSVLARHITC